MEIEFEDYTQSCRVCLNSCQSTPTVDIFNETIDNNHTFANIIEKLTGVEVRILKLYVNCRVFISNLVHS